MLLGDDLHSEDKRDRCVTGNSLSPVCRHVHIIYLSTAEILQLENIQLLNNMYTKFNRREKTSTVGVYNNVYY